MGTPDFLVYIIDDEEDLAEELAKLFQSKDMKTKTFKNAKDFLRDFAKESRGCIVSDIRMPGLSGPDLQEKILETGNPIPFVFISGYADVSTTVKVMSRGARYLFEKGRSTYELINVVQSAIDLDKTNYESTIQRKKIVDLFETLTAREKDIMKGILQGMTNKEMGEAYGISPNTVEIHRARVKIKMNAETLADLIRSCMLIDDIFSSAAASGDHQQVKKFAI